MGVRSVAVGAGRVSPWEDVAVGSGVAVIVADGAGLAVGVDSGLGLGVLSAAQAGRTPARTAGAAPAVRRLRQPACGMRVGCTTVTAIRVRSSSGRGRRPGTGM